MPDLQRPRLKFIDRVLGRRPAPVAVRERLAESTDADGEADERTRLPASRLTAVVMYEHERAWRRLRELHDRALGLPTWEPAVVDPGLLVKRAAAAYARSVGAAAASFALADQRGRGAMAASLADYLRATQSTRGLEGPILTAMTATIEGRRADYESLVRVVSDLGFGPGVGAGGGGAFFLDLRDRSVGFVGEDMLTGSREAFEGIIGGPSDGADLVRRGSGRSNDPALVGMDREMGEATINAVARLVALGPSTVQETLLGPAAAATKDAAGDTAAWMVLAYFASVNTEEALRDAMFAYFYDEENGGDVEQQEEDEENGGEDGSEEQDEENGGEDGSEEQDEENGGEDEDDAAEDAEERNEHPQDEEETTPDESKDDGAPVHDLAYVQMLIDTHSPRTAGEGACRSFWATGDFLVKPSDLVTDPPAEEFTWSPGHPVNLEALFMSRKRPINPITAHVSGDGARVVAVIAVENLAAVPLVVGEGERTRLPW